MIRVELSRAEYFFAAHAGLMRHAQARFNGREAAHGFRGDPISVDIMGALGEYACAKACGRFWSGPGEFRGADVGSGASALQVRTCAEAWHSLILHDSDDDSDIFVLMIGSAERPFVWEMAGWLTARDGKREEFRKNPRGEKNTEAYFVPQSALNSGIPPLREAS